MYTNSVTGKEIPVSPASAEVVNRALVSAHRNGDITDAEYAMTYAEICEVDRAPQLFGGVEINNIAMNKWKALLSWQNLPKHIEFLRNW